MVRESKRYLGLELSGAKNAKTALAVLEFYPKEHKTFLLDIHDRIATECESGGEVGQVEADEALVGLIHDLVDKKKVRMGVNVPLELPPCLACHSPRKPCRYSHSSDLKCSSPAVKWMRELTRKAHRSHQAKVLEFTSYTQRPIELWVRYHVLPKLHAYERFEIDEALGGNKAPLTARMAYLKPHLKEIELIEAWPKLTIATLANQLGLSKRTISTYRRLEEGGHAREEILEALADRGDVFIYEKDIRHLAGNLSAFDAFLCAYTALLSDLEQTASPPAGFPHSTGWVHYPALGAK